MSCCCLTSDPPSTGPKRIDLAIESQPVMNRSINSTTNNNMKSFQDTKTKFDDFWENAETVYNDFDKEGIDVQSILNVAGDITQVIIPNLLSLSSSIPFVGTISIVLVQFYSAVNQTMQNRQAVKEIEDQVNKIVKWLGQSCRYFNNLKKLSPESFQQFHERVKFLTAMIGKSSCLIFEFSSGSTKLETLGKYSKHLFFNRPLDHKQATHFIDQRAATPAWC